ncbi:MAG: hypothetical protein JXJ22_18195 [Bacteroidales bacterium]|nr:hypothetical protein [Bacteroidales bacterium]
MKKSFLVLLFLIGVLTGIFSQETPAEEKFIPNGKPTIRIFTNFHTQLFEDKNASAFEVTRAYFGYNYNFSEEFSGGVLLDVGNPGSGSLQHTAFLKNAFINYKKNNFSANFGMIGTLHFKVQEKFWGRRYIYKSFQDEYGLNPSADLGTSVSYKVADFIQADIALTNGEGYKKVQLDSTYKAGLGITLNPLDGLTIRGYFDWMKNDASQITIATFIGYTFEGVSLGVEYNLQNNNKMIKDHNLSGFSGYGAVALGKKFELFARYDYLTSNTLSGETDDWNLAKDGQLILAGLEFTPVKGIQIAPNFQGWNPADNNDSFLSMIYLNVSVSF